jgi:alpha-mannosidase
MSIIMKIIKQKGEDYVEYAPSLENILESVVYNPRFMKKWAKKMANGSYLRSLKGTLGIFQKITRAKLNDFNLSFIGQSHLDAAWLFPVLDTKLRAYKTFYKAIEHLEKYPFFTFSQTSPQYYQWIKAYSPQLWEKVKKHVSEGRFEPTGGMWIEPTLDECWGESLVRQRLYGQLFFLREFGKFPKVESLLDVFGFPYSLPQILVKSGATAFWTTKCTWNDTNMWPIANYIWRGVDGSEIFTHQYRFQFMALADLGLYLRTARFPKDEHKNKAINTNNTNQEIEELLDTNRLKDLGLFYGWGDGARGPLEIEIGFFKLLTELGHGKFTTTEKYFEEIRQKIEDKLLIWDDEMYLETHRGTKTTQVDIKHYHRLAEQWAAAAENLCTIVNIVSPKLVEYQKERVFEIWRRVLFNEFHDILPGSSIPEVYKLAIKELKGSINDAQNLIKDCMEFITPSKDEFIIYNPLSWVRSGYLSHENSLYYVQNIHPLSTQSINKQKSQVNPETWQNILETDTGFILENEFIKAEILKATGTLISLYYKPLQKELIKKSVSIRHVGAGLLAFREAPNFFHAWNIDPSYPSKRIPVYLIEPAKSIRDYMNLPQIEAKFKFARSRATIRYTLYPKESILRVSVHTDIKTPKIIVKYQIPLTIRSDEVTSEIPYASITRKRKKRTEMQKAKWEMNMQKWVDVSENNIGVTVVNNNRYGFAATPNSLYITLTRTPKQPTPGYFGTYRLVPPKDRPKYTDLKPYDFELGLIPHKGDWKAATAWQFGYEFNMPFINPAEFPKIIAQSPESEKKITSQKKTLTKLMQDNFKKPFVQSNKANILISAIKPSEWSGKEFEKNLGIKSFVWDGKSFIIRLVEQNGENCQVTISFADYMKIHRIEEVNLLEMNPEKPFELKGNTVNLNFHKFEIKTLRIVLK